MIRVLLLWVLLAALGVNALAQDDRVKRSVNVDFMDAHRGFGFSYDSRFSANSNLGWRVSVSYCYYDRPYTYTQTVLQTKQGYTRGFVIPAVELNFTPHLASKKHYADFALGVRCGNYTEKAYGMVDYVTYSGFLTSGYAVVAYRYAPSRGLTVRVGGMLSFKLPMESSFQRRPALLPCVSIGYNL